ncbi:unnamed protein product, partial [Closterium sp. NIES-54]
VGEWEGGDSVPYPNENPAVGAASKLCLHAHHNIRLQQLPTSNPPSSSCCSPCSSCPSRAIHPHPLKHGTPSSSSSSPPTSIPRRLLPTTLHVHPSRTTGVGVAPRVNPYRGSVVGG